MPMTMLYRSVLLTACLCVVSFSTRAATNIANTVSLTDFSVEPIVRIKWPMLNVSVPPSNATSLGYATPEIVVVGSDLVISAVYRLTKPRVTNIDLIKKGLTQESIKTLRVVWKNPDGTMSELANAGEFIWGGRPISPKVH
jgi:hypothetical protein